MKNTKTKTKNKLNRKSLTVKTVEQSPLVVALEDETNFTFTENGAVTNLSTKDSLVDLFAQGGALRTRSENDVNSMFTKAFSEDKLLATKMLFYLRDVRGGQGERKTFRTILKNMALFAPDVVRKNLENVALFGRWDDLFCLFGTDLENDVLALIKKQLNKDIKSKTPSLLAKWLPSNNASSKETINNAKTIANFLNWNQKKYRKTLSNLRGKINILETHLSEKDYSFDYQGVPSRAMLVYRKAFNRNDKDRYSKYLSSVEKGEAKINASTLYPYDIVKPIFDGSFWSVGNLGANEIKQLDLQWKNQPDWTEGNKAENALVMCDISGSMYPFAITVSTSLALYFAERNKGQFANIYLSFSSSPCLIKVKGNTIYEKITNISRENVGYSTNIAAAFKLLLDTAVKNGLKNKDLPGKIMVISDMEFDSCGSDTNFDNIKKMYKDAGYVMPQLVFWNVQARNSQFPVKVNDEGVCLVSGCSPSILKTLLSGKSYTPYDVMLETLNNKRYDVVKV